MIYIDDNPGAVNIDVALETVSRQRREHAMRYLNDNDRRLSLSAYMLLQRALLEEYDIEEPPVFGFSDEGKPFLKDYPDIHFSLSHCREAASCVVERKAVGIDIESLSSFSPDLLDVCMNEEERHEIIASDNPALTFMGYWTMKESFLKLTGRGLSDDMKNVLSQVSHHRFETYENLQAGYVYTVCSEYFADKRQ